MEGFLVQIEKMEKVAVNSVQKGEVVNLQLEENQLPNN